MGFGLGRFRGLRAWRPSRRTEVRAPSTTRMRRSRPQFLPSAALRTVDRARGSSSHNLGLGAPMNWLKLARAFSNAGNRFATLIPITNLTQPPSNRGRHRGFRSISLDGSCGDFSRPETNPAPVAWAADVARSVLECAGPPALWHGRASEIEPATDPPRRIATKGRLGRTGRARALVWHHSRPVPHPRRCLRCRATATTMINALRMS